MVVFNPQGPNTNFPEWTNVSRPISDVIADKSTAIAIGGAADVLNSVVKVTDQAFKDQIKKDVTEGVDNLRDSYTDSLKMIRNTQIAAADKSQSLLPTPTVDQPPAGLQQGLDRVRQIGTAMAQGGNKINDTLYTGSLNAMAKELRNKYPGYRDYIDEQIQSVSGMNPANAFYRNLMEDINRGLEASKTETNRVNSSLQALINAGFHDKNGVSAASIKELYGAGRLDGNQVDRWINGSKKLEFDIQQRALLRKDRQDTDADAAVNAQKDLSMNTTQTIAHAWDTMSIGQGTDTAAKLFKFIQQNAGNTGVQDERSQAIGQQLVALRNATFKQVWDEANSGGSNSLVTKLGGDPEKAKKIIEGHFATWDSAIQAVFNKDWGAAYTHMNFNKAIANDTTNLLYNAPDKDIRQYNRMVGAINNISPQAGSAFFKSFLTSDVPMREVEWLKKQEMELITQPGKDVGSLTSVQKILNDGRAAGAISPKTYNHLINTINTIYDPKWDVEHRSNVARAFFDPTQNGRLLNDENFKRDYYDPATKRQVPGKYSVFTRLASDNVATGVAELTKFHPELTPMYRDTMSRNFGEQLFSSEIRDLGDVNNSATATAPFKIKFTNDPGQPPRLTILGQDNRELTMTEAAAIRAPIGEVNRLNTGMSGLYNVYSKTGSKDATSDVMATIYKYGFKEFTPNAPARGWTGSYTDVPRMIWQSMIAAQQQKMNDIRKRVKEPE